MILDLLILIVLIIYIYDKSIKYNAKLVKRFNGLYLCYDTKHWNKIDCQYRIITHYIKLISYESR